MDAQSNSGNNHMHGADYQLFWSDEQKINALLFSKQSDFIVRERFGNETVEIEVPTETMYEPKPGRKYLCFKLIKSGASTFDCIHEISRYFGVQDTAINYCGLKDRHAVTAQKISLPAEAIKDTKINNFYRFDRFFLKASGSLDMPLRIGLHDSNRFTVRIRKPAFSEKEVAELKDKISFLQSNGVPNFYGIQRFGPDRLNERVGKAILLRDFEQAAKTWITNRRPPGVTANEMRAIWGDWDRLLGTVSGFKHMHMESRFISEVKNTGDFLGAFASIPLGRFFIDSYRSYLFNIALSRLFKESQESIRGQRIELLGYNTKPSGPARAEYERLLSADGLSLEAFKFNSCDKLSTEGTYRDAAFYPKDVELIGAADGLQLSFTLQKGSYATVFLEFLFRNTKGSID